MSTTRKISTLFIAVLLMAGNYSFAQTAKDTIPKNWHQLDKVTTGYYGISLDKAYTFLSTQKRKNKTGIFHIFSKRTPIKSKTILVAVIDGGIDTTHEDLKDILWVNPKEIPGNGIDDDNDGHIDDIHGWNFLGNKDGRNVNTDSYEAARVYNALKKKLGNIVPDSTEANKSEWAKIAIYAKAKAKIAGDVNPDEVAFMKNMLPRLQSGDSVVKKDLNKAEFSCKDLANYTTSDKDANTLKNFMLTVCKGNNSDDITDKELIGEINGELRKADALNNAPEEYRNEVVQDDENNINDRNYGNADLTAGTPFHGTHCSGIIGAIRNNGKGVDGIADNVRIMMVRAVPDGDEHDKDIANAIRYAVDEGAEVISMSFGKDFSPQKQWVDDAVRYAESKGVLLVHAAGNDAKNVDSADNFPNPNFIDGNGRATNMLTVGASGDPKNGGIVANFSNYGKKEVDVFAPGVQIYSTIPTTNNYGTASGTSMAAPVVAGIAALILEYYPTLSAEQVKAIIEKSVQIPSVKVTVPGTDQQVHLSDISKTGGIANAYNALKLASKIKGKRKTTDNQFIIPKNERTMLND